MRPSDNPYKPPSPLEPTLGSEQKPCPPLAVFLCGMSAGMGIAILAHIWLSPVKFACLRQWFQ